MNKLPANFIDLCFESVDENIWFVKKILRDSGIDHRHSLEETRRLIKKQPKKSGKNWDLSRNGP
jgi:hypothetical protein